MAAQIVGLATLVIVGGIIADLVVNYEGTAVSYQRDSGALVLVPPGRDRADCGLNEGSAGLFDSHER